MTETPCMPRCSRGAYKVETSLPADHVHWAFLAALKAVYARVITAEEFLSSLLYMFSRRGKRLRMDGTGPLVYCLAVSRKLGAEAGGQLLKFGIKVCRWIKISYHLVKMPPKYEIAVVGKGSAVG